MEQEKTTQDLKSQILTRIQTESVCPRSRWIYSTQEYAVWALWFVTALFGALAVAITLFVVTQRQFSFYEATHESFFSFALEVLPYLWISIFIIMILFAVYNLRHTKTGYRYPLWQIFGSSLVLSLAGGTLLHLAGVGFSLDNKIGMYAPRYLSQEKMEQKLWQKPEQGRMVGTLVAVNKEVPKTIIFFEDTNGSQWETNIEELNEMDLLILESGKRVRVLGQMIPERNLSFHACAIFPWVYEHEYSLQELSEMRQSMRERVIRYRRPVETLEVLPQDLEKASSPKCADMKVVSRLEFSPAR